MSRIGILRLVLIAGAFSWGVWFIMQTDPPSRKKPSKPPLPLVEVMPSQAGEHKLQNTAYGTVLAAQILDIRAQLGGELLILHGQFEPGGLIPAQSILYKIDPTDYQLQVKAAEANVAKAVANIEIEQGKRKVASEELRLLKGSLKIDAQSRALALRTPQLKQVRAELSNAKNALQQAKTQLQRTQARLAHDVVVLSRDKVAGEILAARDIIGRVARADIFWAELRVSTSLLSRLHARNEQQAGSQVLIQAQKHSYPGEVIRIRAELSAGSRLAGIIVEVQDPLSQLEQHKLRPPLLIGSYVEATIDNGILNNVIAIPRNALHDNGRVWVVDKKNQLQVRQINPIYQTVSQAFIDKGLNPGDRIMLGSADGLLPGSSVRTK